MVQKINWNNKNIKAITSTVNLLVKRSMKYKTGVQPESVKRRTVKKGSNEL